jgi:hypothetical protein
MRTSLLVSAVLAWFLVPGCMFVHDTDCESNSDCKAGRTCQNGACVAGASEGSGTPGAGGTSSVGSGGTGTNPEGPTCTALRSGTQQATALDSSLFCTPAKTSFSVTIGSSGLVQSIDGRSCTLTNPGYSCFETFPDVYECGGCTLRVGDRSIDGMTPLAWGVEPASCAEAGCAAYCCMTESGFWYSGDYYLDQQPGTGTGGSGAGGSGSNCGAPQSCSSCYDECNYSCDGYPGNCVTLCFQGCDRCCSP